MGRVFAPISMAGAMCHVCGMYGQVSKCPVGPPVGKWVQLVPVWGRAAVGISHPARLDKHIGYMSLSDESGWGQGCGLKMITSLHKCYRCSRASLGSLWIWVAHTNRRAAEAVPRMLAPAALPKAGWAERLRASLKQAAPPKRDKSEWLQVDLIFCCLSR